MKKLLSLLTTFLIFGGLFIFFSTQAQTTVSTTDTVCTMEYAPVCGQPAMPECKDGMACPMMMPIPTTYSNKCFLKAAGAEFLYEGKCKDQTVTPPTCPMYDLMKPEPGCKYVFVKDENGCEKPKLECVQCPIYNMPVEKEGCKITWYTDDYGCKKYKMSCESSVCTKEYVPVCGYKEICSAAMSSSSSSNGTSSSNTYPAKCTEQKKTFSNKCEMNNAGYKFVNEGKCEQTVTPECPVYKLAQPKEGCYYEYIEDANGCKKPKLVCKETKCRDYSIVKLASEMNGCPLVWYTDDNGCKVHKYECKKDEKNDILKKRIAQAIENMFKKLDASNKSTQEKIKYLETVAVKLKELAAKKKQYADVIGYAVEMINEKISTLNTEDFQDIFDILN